MKKIFLLIFLAVLLLNVPSAFAFSLEDDYEGPAKWDSFHAYMEKRNEEDRVRGLSYMISGTVAALGGVVGYYSSDDSLSRGIYAIAQSVGVAAIGYGANNYWIGNEYNSFYYAVQGSSLTSAQKGEVLQRFLDRESDQRQKATWIKVATHSLIAVANLYSASREDDKTVRGVLQFLAGTNAVIAFSYAF